MYVVDALLGLSGDILVARAGQSRFPERNRGFLLRDLRGPRTMKWRRSAIYSSIEDPIQDVRALRKWMRNLEEDEAVRIVGNMLDFKGGGFLFVSVCQSKYRMNVCDRIWDRVKRDFMPGEGGKWYEFDSFEEAWRFIGPRMSHPVRAWVY